MNSYGLFQPSKLLATTIGLSLALHVLLWLILSMFDWAQGSGVASVLDDAVELILVDDSDLPPVDDLPRRITLMPERLETEPPEQADYLADVNSRAADLMPGGESGVQPQASRAGDLQTVAISREQLEGTQDVVVNQSVLQPLARPRPAPEPEPTEPAVETMEQGEMPTAEAEETTPSNETETTDENSETTINDFDEWRSEAQTPSLMGLGDRGFDFDQAEVGNVATNVDIVGGYRLNTYEWNFAPWIRRFANDLQRSWIPPYAYGLGIIHGRTEVRVIVERDGVPSRMDVLATEGHESLHKASVAALKACAPYLPLPPDFPENQLVIVFTLIYPELRR